MITASHHFKIQAAVSIGLRALILDHRSVSETQILSGYGSARSVMLRYLENPDDFYFDSFTPKDAYIHFITIDASGSVDVRWEVHSAEPECNAEEWDRIEQLGAEFGYRLPVFDFQNADANDEENARAANFLQNIPRGWNTVRMSCRGMQKEIRNELADQTEILVQIWPDRVPILHQVLKHERAIPHSRSKAKPSIAHTIEASWQEFIDSLREIGITNSEVLQLRIPPLTSDPATSTLSKSHTEISVDDNTSRWLALIATHGSDRWYGVIPDFELLTIDEALAVRRQLLDIWEPGDDYPKLAGQPAYTFVPEYLPIAERDGNLLVVDTRPGDQSGMIRYFDRVDNDDETESWPSLTAFLTEVAAAIRAGEPFMGWRATVTDFGELYWSAT